MTKKHFQEPRTRDQNITKDAPVVLIAQKLSRALRAKSQAPSMKTRYRWEIYFGQLNDQNIFISCKSQYNTMDSGMKEGGA